MQPRTRSLLLAAVVLVAQAGVVVGVARAITDPQPHSVAVSLVGPAVVGESLAADVAKVDGRPFDVVVSTELTEAREDLTQGEVRAVLQLDLSGTKDRMLVLDTIDPGLRDAMTERLRNLDQAWGRTAAVETVTTDGASAAQVRVLTLLSAVIGYAIVAGISMRRGAISRSFAMGTVRLATFAGASSVGGLVLSILVLGRLDLGAAAASALGMLTSATVTQALAVLCGLSGLGLAGALSIGPLLPLLTRTDLALLPVVWQRLIEGSPVGATYGAVRAVTQYDGSAWLLPVGILSAWLVGGLLMLISARVQIDAHSDDTDAVPTSIEPRNRWRVALAVVPVVVATAVLVPLLRNQTVPASARPASKATESKCLATGSLDSVADLNRVSAQLRGGPAFQGADVGASAELQDGRRILLFGDTLRDPKLSGQRFVRNSMLIAGKDCIAVVLPADRGALVPDRPGRGEEEAVGHWPMSVAAQKYPGYDLVTVMTQRVKTTGKGAFDFVNLGPTAAVFVVPRGQSPQLIGTKDFGPDSTDVSRPMWGAASYVSDGWLYLYGTSRSKEEMTFGHAMQVARVRPEQVLQPKEWRYWGGSRWTRSARDAAELIGADGGTSQTLSVFQQGGRWFALSKRSEFLGRDVTVWTAPNPWGPFDQGQKVADLPSDTARGELRYMPLAHPDLLPEPGTVVISFSRNNTEASKVVDNPFLYRPRFLRVELPRD